MSALALALAAILFGSPAAEAGWVSDGVAICTAINNQVGVQVVPDGSGGAIVIWQDLRNGNDDIYAQRVAADGAVLWSVDGVALCLESHSQQRLRAAPDGSGGAVVAWEDYRSPLGAADIYAQRVDASGAALWTRDGAAVCAASGAQQYPSIASDGTGGAVIAWMDFRSVPGAIYIQRIDALGAPVWNLDGFPLSSSGGQTGGRQILTDGAGGAIVAWSAGERVYAQKIAPNSAAQWAAGGAAVCSASGAKSPPTIVSDGAGGAIIAWEDKRSGSGDIYSQRLDASGATQWAADGVAVCAAAADQEHPVLVADGASGAVAVWQDWRNGNLIGDIAFYAQKIGPGGSLLWASDGVLVGSGSLSAAEPDAAGDGSGGVVATWWSLIGFTSKGYVQRIDATGSPRWAPGGVPLCDGPDQTMPAIVADGAGGAIVAWSDGRGEDLDVYAQRFDDEGLVPVATLLREYAVRVASGAPTISWTLSNLDPGVELFVDRAREAGAPYVGRPADMIERNGLAFVFVDEGCEPGKSYWYRVGTRSGGEERALFETGRVTIPAIALSLGQNRPNPFNPATTIEYRVPFAAAVTLAVYDASGRFVASLLDHERVSAGVHTARWNGTSADGNAAGSGVYFYRLTVGKETISRKMVLLK